ncbi:MAG: hypothetical protein ACYC8T_08005 [Myxococcaceae bacterium]
MGLVHFTIGLEREAFSPLGALLDLIGLDSTAEIIEALYRQVF